MNQNGNNGSDNHLTNAQLAEQIARLTHAVNNLLQAGVTGREMAAATRKALEAKASPRAAIVEALTKANGGKPGHLSTVELQEKTGQTKSIVWHHCAELADQGKVVIVRGKRVGGKRGPDVVYHADAALFA